MNSFDVQGADIKGSRYPMSTREEEQNCEQRPETKHFDVLSPAKSYFLSRIADSDKV